MNIKSLAEQLEQGRKVAKFIGLTYKAKSTGEVSRQTIILGASYKKTIEDSILELELLNLEDIAQEIVIKYNGEIKEWLIHCKFAKDELLESFKATLRGENPFNTKRGQYVSLLDERGGQIEGLRLNLNSSSVEIWGLSHSKVVLEEGERKQSISSAKTIAKNVIRERLKVGRFRTFCLEAGHIQTVRINGEEIDFVNETK